jgi:predicted GIY-YIG superfamily endonuclease
MMPSRPQELFMRTQKKYFVYIIMTNRCKMVYTCLTNSLVRRVRPHKLGIGSGFTAKYSPGVLRALPGCPQRDRARERNQKLAENQKDRVDGLVSPAWDDLSAGWYERHPFQPEPVAAQGGIKPVIKLSS